LGYSSFKLILLYFIPGTDHERRVVWEFLKQVGQNLLQGADVMRTAFPVHINQPRSYLEVMCDGWNYAPVFLTRSAQPGVDPVERLRLVMTFLVSGLHMTCSLGKPFNPILGETYQGFYPDGTSIYMEQSSHHPPITSWLVIGPQLPGDGRPAYRMYGSGEWTASFRGNSVRGEQKGTFTIEYTTDGARVQFTLPIALVHGVLWGDRIIEYEGHVEFHDNMHQLHGELSIPPPSTSSFLGSLFGGSKKLPSDYLVGEVYRLEGKERKRISRMQGTWLGAVEFDGRRYWTITDPATPHQPCPDSVALPSDCRFREDIRLLKSGRIKEAAEAKLRLEEAQRRDARLRKEAKEKRQALNRK
jgi:hypothetical protein